MDDKTKLTAKEKKLASMKKKEGNTLIAMATFVLGLLLGYFIWGSNPVPTQQAAPAPQVQAEPIDIPIEGFPSKGPENAPIVIVEFSDFGCSYCSKWHNETYDDLMAAYPDQIRFVYREVPFRAFPASEAAMCAREQGFFWEYHDRLFSYEYGLDDAAFVQYAEELSLDVDAFNTCMSEHRYEEDIQQSLEYATQQLNINSTPTFFINGNRFVGAQPLSNFIQVIEQELAKTN